MIARRSALPLRAASARAMLARALAACALAAGCSDGAAKATPPPATPLAAALATPVDFSFDSIDARPVSSEATRGKVTVVTFVTTSSIPSQAQVDFLVAMAKHDGDRVNYAVVAIEPKENRELVELYVKALSIPFPVALANVESVGGAGPFGEIRNVPVTVLLDRAGRVVWRTAGRVAKSAELRSAMAGL